MHQDAIAFSGICGKSLPNILLKTFPELYPDSTEIYIPKIYGFKIVTLRGSKYEYKYDFYGNCLNKKEIDRILAPPKPKPIPPREINYENYIGP